MRLALALGTLVAACATPRPPDVQSVQAELADALSAGDEVRLAVLLDEEPEALAARLAGAQPELSELGHELAAAEAEESARIHLRTGQSVVLVREADGWRIDRGLLGAPVLATPTDALAALRRALLAIRAAHLGALLSRGTRVLVEDEIERLLRGLADPDAVAVDLEPEHATATLPTGLIVELVLEAGEWRVEDVHE